MTSFNSLKNQTDGMALAGRILLSSIFLISGIAKVLNWNQTSQIMAAEGMILVPLFLLGAIVVEIGAGLSVLFGVKTRWGAAVLFLYLIPTTLIFHDFWNLSGSEQQLQMVNFLKNLAIMGGFFQLMAWGPGRYSVDASSYHRGARHFLDDRDAEVKLRRIS